MVSSFFDLFYHLLLFSFLLMSLFRCDCPGRGSTYAFTRGINCRPDFLTNLDKSRSRRPDSVQPSRRSCRIPGRYRLRCCPREHAGWSVPPQDQRYPYHIACRKATCLACFIGIALSMLLP